VAIRFGNYRMWAVFAIVQFFGLAIAWEGNVHGPFLVGWLLLLPSSLLLFLFDSQLGETSYHVQLLAAMCLNAVAIWGIHRWRIRSGSIHTGL
jgi:hypothetical protein